MPPETVHKLIGLRSMVEDYVIMSVSDEHLTAIKEILMRPEVKKIMEGNK